MNRSLIIGIVVVLLLCCCGGSAATLFLGGGIGLLAGAVQGPNATANAFYDAVKNEDWAKAQAQLAPAMRSDVSAADIEESFVDSRPQNGKVVSLNITNTNINGTTAVVQGKLKWEKTETTVVVNLVQIDGEWKISKFG